MSWFGKNKDLYIWIAIILVDLILVFINQSTHDNGDSILHYLQAHQAFNTPELFVEMWAKPVFVLLASPLASLGWWGMKLFNSICVIGSAFFTYKLFKHYNFEKWWAVFLCFFAYSFFLIQSSGLTEPLFALFLIAIIYYEINDQTKLALVLLSFLPFVRAEGWIVAVIIVTYLFAAKKFKFLPYLLLGTVLYGVIGLFVFQDFLWMFNQNPYNGIESKYGSGDAFHYFVQIPYLIGLPICILFILGIANGVYSFFIKGMDKKEFYLIYGITLGYIVAHSIFWYYGLFHSFGLNRVLLVLVPLFAFIAYRGIELLISQLHFIKPIYLKSFLVLVIVIFPFTNNKMAMPLPQSFQLNDNQKHLKSVANWIESNNYTERSLYSNAYFIPFCLDKRIGYNNELIEMKDLFKSKPKKGSLIAWDSYFSVTDSEVSKAYIESNFDVTVLQTLVGKEDYTVIVYEVN
ncbi:MAG: hypothetical protein HKP14_07645 [Bacteroidia bacterium]|nr:hypothetical protein [Bacteroidia bacterium]